MTALARLRGHVEALAAMERDSAGPGERAAAEWVAARLREAGVADVRVEFFRYQSTYGWVHGAHVAAGVAAVARAGLPGALLALGALASLEWEASGRRQWLRRLLPAGTGANVVGRIPARGERRATLVLCAHHDAAHTGLAWSPRIVQAGAARHRRNRAIEGFQQPTAVGFALAALGSLAPGAAGRTARGAGAALLALTAAADVDIARSPTVPGASDNATGVAAVVELARALAAEPLDGVEVVALSTGCEESGMGGMAAFLRAHGAALRPSTTLVLSLDTLGAGTPALVRAEGTIATHRYRPEDLALADAGAARAGEPPPERWRLGGWTDPILARHAGLPAISLVAMGPGYLPNYHVMTDTPDRVEWSSVERCTRIAGGIAEAFAARWAA